MMLVFGMTVVIGCDDGIPEDDYEYDDRPSIPGFARIDNYYPVVGETITASYDAGYSTHPRDPIGTPSWRWYKTQEYASSLSSVTNKTSIGYSNTYTVSQDDVGYWIWAELSYSGNRGTNDTRTSSTAIGIPATANVSVSISAVYYPTYYSQYYTLNNHNVTVTLTLSDGRWGEGISVSDIPYSTASQWLTISGTPSISLWSNPIVSARGRELVFSYGTRSETTQSINLTATVNTAQLSAMRSNTNVYNTLSAGSPSTVSVSQWTISQY